MTCEQSERIQTFLPVKRAPIPSRDVDLLKE